MNKPTKTQKRKLISTTIAGATPRGKRKSERDLIGNRPKPKFPEPIRLNASRRNAAPTETSSSVNKQISAYSEMRPTEFRAMCNRLRRLIETALPKATSRVWHGSPVWFDGENPIVGYSATAKSVNLLFWNGQALDEPALKPVGKYSAAQAVFHDASEIDSTDIRRWLKKAKYNVFDSVAFFKKLRDSK